jgi:hypothetical protein
MYYNPAAIAKFTGRRVSASYNNYLAGIQAGYLAYVTSWGRNTSFGISANYMNFGSTPKTGVDGSSTEDFGGGDFALSMTIARLWPSGFEGQQNGGESSTGDDQVTTRGPGFGAGLTAKFIYESIDIYSSDALAVDVGVLYGLKDNRTRLGLSVSNLGFQMKSLSSGHKDELPLVLRAGFNHELKASPFEFAGDAVKPIDNDIHFTFGVNFRKLQPVELRAGYSTLGENFKTRSGSDDFAGLSLGLGIKLEKLEFDYAFVPYADIGNSHRISISSRW